jgi:hypothetical protein
MFQHWPGTIDIARELKLECLQEKPFGGKKETNTFSSSIESG